MFGLMLVLIGFQPQGEVAVDLVKRSYLDINEFAPIGLVFENYSWFQEISWHLLADKDGRVVIFSGTMDDAQATAAFEKRNKYRFGFALKAMQLAPAYGLNQDKQRLRFTIHFQLHPEGGFKVATGFLEIFEAKTQAWRREPFTDKALLAVIKGIYADEDPYTCLVKGLPYE